MEHVQAVPGGSGLLCECGVEGEANAHVRGPAQSCVPKVRSIPAPALPHLLPPSHSRGLPAAAGPLCPSSHSHSCLPAPGDSVSLPSPATGSALCCAENQGCAVWLESVLAHGRPREEKAERWSAVGRLRTVGPQGGLGGHGSTGPGAPEPRSRSSTMRRQRTGCSPGETQQGLVLLPAVSRAEGWRRCTACLAGAGPDL